MIRTKHATERMVERDVDPLQLQRCLAGCQVQEAPWLDIATGDWRCNAEGFAAGDNLRIGIALPDDTTAVVVTVIVID